MPHTSDWWTHLTNKNKNKSKNNNFEVHLGKTEHTWKLESVGNQQLKVKIENNK